MSKVLNKEIISSGSEDFKVAKEKLSLKYKEKRERKWTK